ncbi:14657_t:CDS:2 [Entrophospora sp. SA101]|nr:14657_t:CDS:2 [Entrophospora sp. SA101]
MKGTTCSLPRTTCISLPDSCIKYIFEYSEDDMNSSHLCLLVNRVWCTWAVGILWRDTERYLDPLTDSKRVLSAFHLDWVFETKEK